MYVIIVWGKLSLFSLKRGKEKKKKDDGLKLLEIENLLSFSVLFAYYHAFYFSLKYAFRRS